ncbi:hypothetical protein HYT92_02210 [Candidatus Pacearchaeota archaeon]|nr:hypothetical protein [Candidatus Pacearchaeota archaeon]
MGRIIYMRPVGYGKSSNQNSADSICIPGCDVCCHPNGSGIGVTRADYAKNLAYNRSLGNGGIEVRMADYGGPKLSRNGSKFIAEIPAEEVTNSDSIAEIINLFRVVGRDIDAQNPLTRCVHAKRVGSSNGAKEKTIQQLVDAYNAVLAPYGFELTAEDLQGVNFDRFGRCEVYESPRSTQCQKQCDYSAKHLPRLLKRHGKKLFLELLRTPTLEDRFRIINEKLRDIDRGRTAES